MPNAATTWDSALDAAKAYQQDLDRLLEEVRNIKDVPFDHPEQTASSSSIEQVIISYVQRLRQMDRYLDADALDQLHNKLTKSAQFGGLDLASPSVPSAAQYREVLFETEAHLESVNAQIHSRSFQQSHTTSNDGRHPMTLAQKIFMQHAIAGIPPNCNSLAAGDVIRAGIDWVIASELSWASMAQTYEELGKPGIWRNDRLWIAGDHVVHPSIATNPKIKAYVETAEKAKRDFKMTEYQGMNYTIMHTEFVRERAEPGMLIVGSDSHTCSAGAVGCLSIGLGAADVMMTLALGETWWKVPESVRIELTGKPSPAISGKDVILYILKVLKRNTVAAERIVEFVGDGVQYLSVEARFAICNMCTEFGAITGIFTPDAITQQYVNSRKRKANKTNSLYFCPDDGAEYAERCTIDLTLVEPSIARYPNPDDVVPVSAMAGLDLDGVFIGACTTTEEELVLAGLVLQEGLKKGLVPAPGKRHYVPGSLPIVEKLRELGILDIYEAAGFTRGPPGCSMCVGLSAEKAAEGETWLSSQNRNFKNRMGKGAIGHVTSAAVCAASSFSMKVTDPAFLLDGVDFGFFERYKGIAVRPARSVEYVEPSPAAANTATPEDVRPPASSDPELSDPPCSSPTISSKISLLGDFIDTDALAPGFTLTTCTTDAEFGQHVLCHTHPSFRQQVRDGHKVVVAGHAFGVGSSRECAVSALKGAGVQAVIARSFAFIYGRNQPSLGLLGIVMRDEEFYGVAKEGCGIEVDVERRRVMVGGRTFGFELSEIEFQLTQNKGITESYKKYGKAIWDRLLSNGQDPAKRKAQPQQESHGDSRLEW